MDINDDNNIGSTSQVEDSKETDSIDASYETQNKSLESETDKTEEEKSSDSTLSRREKSEIVYSGTISTLSKRSKVQPDVQSPINLSSKYSLSAKTHTKTLDKTVGNEGIRTKGNQGKLTSYSQQADQEESKGPSESSHEIGEQTDQKAKTDAAFHFEHETNEILRKFYKQQNDAKGVMLYKILILNYYNILDPVEKARYLLRMRPKVISYSRGFSEMLRTIYPED